MASANGGWHIGEEKTVRIILLIFLITHGVPTMAEEEIKEIASIYSDYENNSFEDIEFVAKVVTTTEILSRKKTELSPQLYVGHESSRAAIQTLEDIQEHVTTSLNSNNDDIGSFSLEPGGQVEWSSPAFSNIHDLNNSLQKYKNLIDEILNKHDLINLYIGVDPFNNPESIDLINQKKYQLMNESMVEQQAVQELQGKSYDTILGGLNMSKTALKGMLAGAKKFMIAMMSCDHHRVET